MLEYPTLLLPPRGASATQAIVDASTGAPLGRARWRGGPWWERLLCPTLAVHEHEDEPLLFTVRRCWGLRPRHEVRDAEGRRVGFLQGPRVRNRFGRELAVLRQEEGGAAFRTPDGRSLALLTAGPEGVQVAFSTDIDAEPFVKMLLLAAALGTTGRAAW
jgi:hypothetical protein